MKNINLLIKPPRKSAFTLVELIIVITILAILATIAFISFKNYSGNARDGNKLTTLSNIEKGLSLYQVKTGNYPTPDNIYGSGNYSGTLLSQVGYIGTGVIQSINMNTTPKDPITDSQYTYGLSNNKKYYQLGSVLENNQMSFINQTYANNYTSKVVGNYKGLYTFNISGENYIINLPSLIFTESGPQNFENTGSNPKFVINNGENLVKPYDKNNNEPVNTTLLKLTGTGVSLTGAVIPSNWNTSSGILKDILGYSEDSIGQEIYGNDYNSDNKNLQTPIQWRDIQGTNCDNDDYLFTTSEGVTYRWAGCNSVLGGGVEWGKKDDGSDGEIGNCYDYSGHISTCGTAQMLSSAKENAWNPTAGTVNNIWGKLYTYEQASDTTNGACPSGWHLPTDAEWTALEIHLNKGVCTITGDWQCPGVGWTTDSSKNRDNNIVQALKLPLSGYRDINETTFNYRGYVTGLWSSSSQTTTAYTRSLSYNTDWIMHYQHNMKYAFSARCVKN